jgi:hypothetical protein
MPERDRLQLRSAVTTHKARHELVHGTLLARPYGHAHLPVDQGMDHPYIKHAGVDTVMIYAKLCSDSLVEGYRAALRGLYGNFYNADELRDASSQEWAAFTASCSLRDMGTHICALPTGEHCSRGLVRLGCHHAQPKKSAAPTFRRMIASHTRALTRAQEAGEPAGQLAAREFEIQRLRDALARADELTQAASDALEAAAM